MDYTLDDVPESWRVVLGSAASRDTLDSIARCIVEKSAGRTILSPRERVFAALEATPFDTRHAMGLAFSVPDGVTRLPQSLKNIRTELRTDCKEDVPDWRVTRRVGRTRRPAPEHGAHSR